MSTKTARLDVIANTRQYQAEFAKLPGFTNSKAAAMAAAMSKHHMKMQLQAAKAARSASTKAASAWKSSMSTAAGIISADLIKGFGRAVVGIGQGVADLRNGINDLGGQTALANDTLSGLRLAAKLSGGDLSDLNAGLKRFPKVLQDFADGTGDGTKALERLGFEQKDAQKMLADTDGSLREVMKRLQGVDNEGIKAAASTAIFSRSGGQLTQVLGNIPLEEYIAMTAEFGDSVGPEAVAASQQWEIASARLGGMLEQTKGKLSDFLNLSGKLESFTLGFVYLREVGNKVLADFTHNLTMTVMAQGALWEAHDPAAAVGFLKSMRLNVVTGLTEANAAAMETTKTFWEQTQTLKANAKATDEAGRALAQTTDEEKKAAKAARDAAKASAKAARAQAKLRAEQKRAAAAAAAQQEQEAQALDQLAAISRDLRSDQMTAVEKINAAHEDEVKRIWAVAKATGDRKNGEEALREAQLRRQRDVAAALQEEQEQYASFAEDMQGIQADMTQTLGDMWSDYIQKAVGDFMSFFDTADMAGEELLSRNFDRIAAEVDNEKEKRRDLRDEKLQLIEDIDKAEDDATKHKKALLLQEVKGELKAQKQLVKSRKDAMKKAALAQRAAAVFAIAVQTAAAVMMAAASAPPPLNLIPMGAMAAAGVAQGVIVATEPLPTRHAGTLSAGRPMASDEQAMIVRDGESVLNQRSTQIRDMNADPSAGGGGRPMVVHLQLGQRTMQTAFVDGMRSPGPMQDAILTSADYGFVNPYGGT